MNYNDFMKTIFINSPHIESLDSNFIINAEILKSSQW